MRRAVPVHLAVLALALLAGCGSNQDPSAPSGQGPGSGGSHQLVAEADVARVVRATMTVDALCQGQRPPAAELQDATRTLVQVYDFGPEADFEYGSDPRSMSMRTVLQHEAQRLQRCGAPAYAQQLERALRGS